MKKTIVHVDMDAFFASVEQLDNPDYRNKPVIVGADPKEGSGRGVVSTCSYEAREYGIHSAMPISKAYRLCPEGIYVKPRGKRYAQISKNIMKIFHDFTPAVEKISVDEAFLDMSGCEHFYNSFEDMGNSIKNKMKEITGLTASVGIASNKSIAKIASDLDKPDGLTICPKGEEKDFLADLSLSKLWGVGKKTLKKLHKMGYKKIKDIAELPEKIVKKKFGKHGKKLWELANGVDPRDVVEEDPVKSISNEITFKNDTADWRYIKNTLFKICDKVAYRLRKKELKAKTIFIKIRLSSFNTYTRRITMKHFIDNTNIIYKKALDLFKKNYRKNDKVRLIGMGVSKFKETGNFFQLNLFESKKTKANNKIDKILDQGRKKFGSKITRAAFLKNKNKE